MNTIDIKKIKKNDITYVKPLNFPSLNRNLSIFNKQVNDDSSVVKKKIIFITPKMMAPFGFKKFENKSKSITSYSISFSFASVPYISNDEAIKSFYQFVKMIDEINIDTIGTYRSKWKLPKSISYRSSLVEFDDYADCININLPFDRDEGFLFNVYNEEGMKSSIDIINERCLVSACIELSDIWFNEKLSMYGCNWNVLQIRKHKKISSIQSYFMNNCVLGDSDDESLTPKPLPVPQQYPSFIPLAPPPPPPMPIKHRESTSISTLTPTPPPPISNRPKRIIISPDELNCVKSKLKKTPVPDKEPTYIEAPEFLLKNKTVLSPPSEKTKKTNSDSVSDKKSKKLSDEPIVEKKSKKVIENQDEPIIEKKSKKVDESIEKKSKKIIEDQEPVEKKSKKIVEDQEPVEKKSKKIVEDQEPVVEKKSKKVVEDQEPIVEKKPKKISSDEPIVEKKSKK